MTRKKDKYAGAGFHRPTANHASVPVGEEFGCHLFKTENVSDLLSQLDDRIDIIEKVANEARRIEGINLIELWRNLYKDIWALWERDVNAPFITLTKYQEVQLNVIADIVALFFLYNGSEVDNEFLKNVQDLFADVNSHYGAMTTEERFAELKKMMAHRTDSPAS